MFNIYMSKHFYWASHFIHILYILSKIVFFTGFFFASKKITFSTNILKRLYVKCLTHNKAHVTGKNTIRPLYLLILCISILQSTTDVHVGLHYSLSRIVQITDFLDFLHEHCEEKSETFTEF